MTYWENIFLGKMDFGKKIFWEFCFGKNDPTPVIQIEIIKDEVGLTEVNLQMATEAIIKVDRTCTMYIVSNLACMSEYTYITVILEYCFGIIILDFINHHLPINQFDLQYILENPSL